MRKRLFIYTTVIICIGLMNFFAASVYVTYSNNLNIAKDAVMETAELYSDMYTDVGYMLLSSISKLEGDTRITVIDSDGTVLADSRPLDMGKLENHLTRPEIQAALNGSPAAFTRFSDTLGVDLIYYALKVHSDSDSDSYVYVRAAMPVAKIDAYLFRLLPLLIFLLILVALLCFFLVRSTINRIISPFSSVEQKLRLLSNGEYNYKAIAGSYEEINKIVRKIDDVAFVLQENFDTLLEEKNKFNYVINNIADGIFAVDENKNISLINSVALDIFNVTPNIMGKNLNYLSYDKNLNEAVEDCVHSAKDALFELTLNGNIFLVTVKQLPDTKLTMAVLSNVTENRENAKRREEFFANASHELKTPLTAIKGFNELTAIHNKDEHINKYIDSITRETERMLTLIGDMLKLSALENTQDIKPVSVSLANIVNEVFETMSTAVSEKAIVFKSSGDAVVEAESLHIYELIKNLIENAVRYNNQGGKISVNIENDKKVVRLAISDNGIGISSEEQTRIFERFYRVEKSRSQRNGGTGLGLSIVKHICALYGWNLSLKSKLGVGTEIIIVFREAEKTK